MNYKMMGKFIAMILAIEDIFMIPALCISIALKETAAIRGFLCSMGIITVLALVLYFLCRKETKKGFYAKEGLVCVGVSWIVMGLLGCLPFYISREIPAFIDAFFETISGFTTTGSSILPQVETLSKSILYWRSFTHWLGGMGVLVFLLAVVSVGGQKGGYTLHLLRAESPGPNVGKMVPKMKDTAKILYLLYILLTVLDIIFLLLGNIPLFDAVCTAFGTAGTGGFGIKNDSIAGYSPYIQNVCTVFMILFGVNFNCYYLLLMKKFRAVYKDEEVRTYFGIILSFVILITINIRGMYGSIGEALRHAAFQVASLMTTTGFATTDFDLWPSFSKGLLLFLMFCGACAGSTGGGLKVSRFLLLLKTFKRGVKKILQPRKVEVVKLNGQKIDEKILESTSIYLIAYVTIIIVSFLIISLDNMSMMTNFSAVMACFNNIGPGFEAVGATCNFSGFSVLSKLVLILDMLAGRLEIFPILILFSTTTWKKNY